MEFDQTYDLEGILEDKGARLVPPPLKTIFEKELSNLASAMRKQIGLEPDSELDLEQEAETIIQNWLDDLREMVEQLRDAFVRKMDELVPEKFSDSVTKDLLGLILTARGEINRKKRTDPNFQVDIDKEAEASLNMWVEEEKLPGYSGYKKLMRRCGNEAVPLKRFEFGRLSSISKRYAEIETKDIKVGSKVTIKDDPINIYTVIAISFQCLLSLKADNDKDIIMTPFVVEIVDSEKKALCN